MTFAVTPTTLRPPAALAGWRRRPGAAPPLFAVVLATSSGVGGERTPPTFARLREEFLQLHAEADLTQSKGNMSVTGTLNVVLMGPERAPVSLSKCSDTSYYSKRGSQRVQFDLSPVTCVSA